MPEGDRKVVVVQKTSLVTWFFGCVGLSCLGLVAASVLGLGTCGVMVGRAAKEVEAQKLVAARKAAEAPVSNLTFEQVDDVFTSLQSKATDIQKKEAWKQIAGRKIRWTGEVVSISETFGVLQLQVKHKQETFGSDVIVHLQPDQKSKAMRYNKGNRITYSGILDDFGAIITGIEVEYGVIED